MYNVKLAEFCVHNDVEILKYRKRAFSFVIIKKSKSKSAYEFLMQTGLLQGSQCPQPYIGFFISLKFPSGTIPVRKDIDLHLFSIILLPYCSRKL